MNNAVNEQQLSKIDKLKAHFKLVIDTTESNFIIIGETLNELQQEMEKDNINFREWLKQETRISYSTANRYMKVAEEYETREHQERRNHVIVLGIKKAYLLLKIVDIDKRYKFIKDNEIKYRSYEITKELLAEYLNTNHSDEKDSSNNKDILDKSERKLIKEIEKYNGIIDNLEIDKHDIYYEIKCKLSELQKLLSKVRNYDEEVRT